MITIKKFSLGLSVLALTACSGIEPVTSGVVQARPELTHHYFFTCIRGGKTYTLRNSFDRRPTPFERKVEMAAGAREKGFDPVSCIEIDAPANAGG